MWTDIALAPSLHPYFLYSFKLEDARRYLKSGVQCPYTHTPVCACTVEIWKKTFYIS